MTPASSQERRFFSAGIGTNFPNMINQQLASVSGLKKEKHDYENELFAVRTDERSGVRTHSIGRHVEASEANYSIGLRPGESEKDAWRRAVLVHDKAIQRSLDDKSTADWPSWLQLDHLTRLEDVESISAAMDRYYKADRLNQSDGMRESLIRSRQREFTGRGWTVLTSRHDSVNGCAMYIRKEAGRISLYTSTL